MKLSLFKHQYYAVWTTVIVNLLIITFQHSVANGQHQLRDRDLKSRGIQEYRKLPVDLGPGDAGQYSKTVRYFYAYEQRRLRSNKSMGTRARRIFAKLYHHLDDVEQQRADGESSRLKTNRQLRDKGLNYYKKVRANSDGNKAILDAANFIRAEANLYAYIQCDPDPDKRAKEAIKWLMVHRDELAPVGFRGDGEPAYEEWRPSPRRRGDGRRRRG